jgi:hypothetical protein
MRHAPPTLGAGWGPMAAPPATSRLWPKIRRQIIIIGGLTLVALFTGILASPRGTLAVMLAWALVNLLASSHQRFRTLLQWVAVGALAVIVATAVTTSPKVQAPPLRPPARVDAAQADQLAQLREGVVNLYEQIAKGFPSPEEGGR